jgi:hypothetical protein
MLGPPSVEMFCLVENGVGRAAWLTPAGDLGEDHGGIILISGAVLILADIIDPIRLF